MVHSDVDIWVSVQRCTSERGEETEKRLCLYGEVSHVLCYIIILHDKPSRLRIEHTRIEGILCKHHTSEDRGETSQ